MTRDELLTAMASDAGITKAQAGKALRSFTKHVGDAMRNGDRLELSHFGTFAPRVYRESRGRNPRTGAPVQIPAMAKVHFKTSKALREQLQTLVQRELAA